MALLKVSTAVTVPIGPFVSVGDSNTEKTALVITKAMVKISKNNGIITSKAVANTARGGTQGWYRISFSVTDANTLGNFLVYIHPTNVLPVWARFDIVNTTAFNAYRGVGGWNLKANAISAGIINKGALLATKFATNAIDSRIIKAGAVSNSKIANLAFTATKFATNAITGRSIGADAISTAKVAAGTLRASVIGALAITEARIGTGAISARVLGNNAVSNAKIANLAFSETKFATNAITNRIFGTTAVNKIVTANNAVVIDGAITRIKSEKLGLGMAAGDMRFSVGVYYIKDQAGATIYTLTVNDTDRDVTVV